ncbi:hypothetical protein BOTBODRAFT_106566 [Botryobasidium botryosum FD-172 SS1]|uniref:DDE-1 domain-containing protein n=1 Tax=Botryobasidium botryosum (strain FD-172 SS1) TaxID=930990 RepID=A0A067MY14_BOTB1|nr:hypothetical protein BOTBODRAFT_106566 [Botryobasidium botryosum FD-172 SS1]
MFHSIASHFEAKMVELGLPPHSPCVVTLDAWSVHRGQEFRDWVSAMFPWIFLIYIPAGCTGLFQPCDVGIQRILKLVIKWAAHADIVNETLAMLDRGITPELIVLDKRVATMRDRSVRWVVEAHKALSNKDLVKKVRRAHNGYFNILI